MRMIFEDSYKNSKGQVIGSSLLLSQAYLNDSVSVEFAESNDRLSSKMKRDNEVCLIFPDLVADNINTWGVTKALMDKVVKRKFTNTFIVPIPCIEFIFILAFGNSANKSDFDIVRNREVYLNSELFRKVNITRTRTSFEKFCKIYCSSEFEDKLFVNDSNSEFFNMNNCWKLISKLPMFINSVNNSYVNIEVSDIVRISDTAFESFINQVKLYSINEGYKIGNLDDICNSYRKYKEYIRQVV